MKININISRKKLRYGSYSIAVIIIFIAAVIGLNLIVNAVPVSADLTPNKLFSISERTSEVLEELDQEVIIYAFFDEVNFRDSYVELHKLMEDYTSKNSNIKIKYIDAYKNPGEVNKLDPDKFYKIQPNNFLFVSGDKKRKVTMSDFTTKRSNPFTGQTYDELAIEETLTGAIIFVTAEDTPIVYFIQGHGELDLSRISALNEYLKRNNFDVRTLETLTAETIPEEADMLVFLSPQTDITIEERIKIQDFLDDTSEKNKALMVFIDPVEQGTDYAQINLLLEKYNLKFNSDFLSETDSEYFLPGQPFYLLPEYTQGGYKVFAPFSRSVEILKNQKEFITEEALLITSEGAESVDVISGETVTGLRNVAARVDYKGGYFPLRIFAIGNTSFLNDQVIANYENNMEFMLEQIRWSLMREGSSIYIAGKPAFDTTIKISQRQATAISLALIIIIPLILFGVGTIIYVRRKNL